MLAPTRIYRPFGTSGIAIPKGAEWAAASIGADSDYDAVSIQLDGDSTSGPINQELVVGVGAPWVGPIPAGARVYPHGRRLANSISAARLDLMLWPCVPPIVPTQRAPRRYEALLGGAAPASGILFELPAYGRSHFSATISFGYAGAFTIDGLVGNSLRTIERIDEITRFRVAGGSVVASGEDPGHLVTLDDRVVAVGDVVSLEWDSVAVDGYRFTVPASQDVSDTEVTIVLRD